MLAIAAGVSSCDSGASTRTGTVVLVRDDLICIAPEDLDQAVYCVVGAPASVDEFEVGMCVASRSRLDEPLGGDGTLSHPEKLLEITELKRECRKPDHEVTIPPSQPEGEVRSSDGSG
jgi:hypothetical protein